MTTQVKTNLEKVQDVLIEMKNSGKIRDFVTAYHLEGFLIFQKGNGRANIPLKIKNSKDAQIIHKQLHPHIPSLRIGNIGMPAVLEEKLIEVIDGFEGGKILHV